MYVGNPTRVLILCWTPNKSSLNNGCHYTITPIVHFPLTNSINNSDQADINSIPNRKLSTIKEDLAKSSLFCGTDIFSPPIIRQPAKFRTTHYPIRLTDIDLKLVTNHRSKQEQLEMFCELRGREYIQPERGSWREPILLDPSYQGNPWLITLDISAVSTSRMEISIIRLVTHKTMNSHFKAIRSIFNSLQ